MFCYWWAQDRCRTSHWNWKPRLMEFFCVMSVDGSLASYLVKKESDSVYKAALRSTNGKREDLPSEIILEKTNGSWQAQPWRENLVQSIILAIEANVR